MQRKFLEELGLEKEVVDKIMTENGNDINKIKEKLEAERDNYKSQLETATESLDKFKDIDVDRLKGEAETLRATLATKEPDVS